MVATTNSFQSANTPQSDCTLRAPLIICVGNPSRGDDAIGPLIAEALQQSETTRNLNVIETFQLQPELVEDLVGHSPVLIIDAQANAEQPVTVRRITASPTLGWCSHALSPEQLICLYQTTFQQAAPDIIAIGIQAKNFELGASPATTTLALISPVIDALSDLTGGLQTPSTSVDILDFLQTRLHARCHAHA